MKLRTVILITLLWPALVAAATATQPELVVRQVMSDALQTMSENKAQIAEQRRHAVALIRETALPHTDMARMARFVLGGRWQSATPDQRERFTLAFTEHVVRTSATAMRQYADEIAEFARQATIDYRRLSERDHRAVVRTTLSSPRLRPLDVDLHLHNYDGRWKVYDIQIKGVSVLLSYKAQLLPELLLSDLETVIASLEQR